MQLARGLLQSPQWADRAWGVYLVGRLHSDDLNNLLVEEFRKAALIGNASPSSEEYAFVAALFDGAIEAGVTVPVALLEPFEQRWAAPVLILLARSQDGEGSLLRLSENPATDQVWLAANNLLFERKSASWYARTLRELPATHVFVITDPDTGGGIGTGIRCGGVGCEGPGLISMPKGFPPIGLYGLSVTPRQGSTLLAHGPTNIYYDRTVVPTDKTIGAPACNAQMLNRESTRFGYLSELTGVPTTDLERVWHRSTNIQYHGPEATSSEMQRALSAQEEAVRGVLQRIKDRGLTPERGTTLQIYPSITDLRRESSGPLPAALQTREIVLD
jgi:hypothetical protein